MKKIKSTLHESFFSIEPVIADPVIDNNKALPAEFFIDGKFQAIKVSLSDKEDKDDEPKEAEVIAVVGGWNKNNKFLTKELMAELPAAMMAKPKLYMDHDFFGWGPRSTKEWAATFTSARYDEKEDRVVCRIVFTENPATKWLYSESKKNKSQVQLSIHIYAVGEEFDDKEQNRKGVKLTKLQMYESTDFVNYAAAGGEVIQVLNSLENSNGVESFTNIINSNNSNLNGENNNMDFKTLLAQHPELVKEIKALGVQEHNFSTQIESTKSENEALKVQLSEKTASLLSTDADLVKAKKEVEDLKVQLSEVNGKIQKIEDDKKDAEFKASVDKEAEALPEAARTAVFMTELYSKKSIDEVKALVEDRKSTLEVVSVQLGAKPGDAQKQENNSNQPDSKVSVEDLANIFNN